MVGEAKEEKLSGAGSSFPVSLNINIKKNDSIFSVLIRKQTQSVEVFMFAYCIYQRRQIIIFKEVKEGT